MVTETRMSRLQKVIGDYNEAAASEMPPAQHYHRFDGDLGMDSLDMLEIQLMVEDEFGFDFEESEVEGSPTHRMKTVQEMLDTIGKHLGPEFPDENGFLELTETQFINRYKPEEQPDGSYYLQREWFDSEDIIKKAISEKRCWTAVDGDNGEFLIIWGNRVVNRIYNIITEKPIEDEDWHIQVLDPDPRIIECEVKWAAPNDELPQFVIVNIGDLELDEVTEENSSLIADHIAEMYDSEVESFDYKTKS